MKGQRIAWVGAALLAALLAAGQRADPAEVLLKTAMHKELVDGDLKAAIAQYQKALARAGTNRAVAAKALLGMGQCHEKLGEAEARKAYERLVREYADQVEAVAQARTRLVELGRLAHPSAVTLRRVWVGQGSDASGGISPDGRYLSFTDWETGDLAVRDLATGQNRRRRLPTASRERTWGPPGPRTASTLPITRIAAHCGPANRALGRS